MKKVEKPDFLVSNQISYNIRNSPYCFIVNFLRFILLGNLKLKALLSSDNFVCRIVLFESFELTENESTFVPPTFKVTGYCAKLSFLHSVSNTKTHFLSASKVRLYYSPDTTSSMTATVSNSASSILA